MSRRTRFLLLGLAAGLAAALVYGAWMLHRLAPIGAGYTAKMLCSGVFVSHRPAHIVLEEDIRAGNHPLLQWVSVSVDAQGQRVSATALAVATRVAQYRPGRGCALAVGPEQHAPRDDRQGRGPTPVWEELPSRPAPPGVDAAALQSAVNWAFDDQPQSHTRTVVVLNEGRIVAERYAPGFSPRTPMPGWSMSKTVAAALAGVVVKQGQIALDSKALLPEWRGPSDPRAQITLNHLLRMTDGIAFRERHDDPLSDVAVMLFATGDSSGYAAAKPLDATPGTRWRYSSGTSNLLMRALRVASEHTSPEFTSFVHRALLDRIGMRDAVFESDASGMPVASSYLYASPHDWVRFGQFLLQDGVWKAERILPAGWVRYMTTLTPQSTRRDFGAHLWVRVPPPFNSQSASPPALPADAFHLVGHEGQLLSVIPSNQLVVLRLGLTRNPNRWDHEAFLAKVLEAFPREDP